MKHRNRTLCILVFGLLGIRCGGTTGPQAGSESHFLDRCTADDACAPLLSCICGVCSRTCATDASCTDLGSAAICTGGCTGGSSYCNVPCTGAADCEPLGAGFQCESGACRKNPPAGAKDAGTDAGREAGPAARADSGAPNGPDAARPDARARLDATVDAPGRDATFDAPTRDATRVGSDGAIPACDGAPCFCQHLPSCTPVREFIPLPLGSVGRLVCGARIRKGNPGGLFCEVTAFQETEGGVTAERCEVPLGETCSSWLPGATSPYCHETVTCNVLMQSCPADLLDCNRPGPCTPRQPSVDLCCNGYAVSSLSGKCECSCFGTEDPPPFATLADCQAACGVPDPGPSDGAAPGAPDASACASLETDIVAEWQKLAECSASSDCTTAYNNLCASSGPIIGNVGCFLPLSKTADVSRLATLEQQYVRGCAGQPGTCDCNAPPPSECVAGHCRVTTP